MSDQDSVTQKNERKYWLSLEDLIMGEKIETCVIDTLGKPEVPLSHMYMGQMSA